MAKLAVKPKPKKKKKDVPIDYRADGTPIYGRNDQGQPICNSMKWAHRRGGKPCQSIIIMAPSGRCKKHGGKAPSGPANGMSKVLQYSKYAKAPISIRERMEQFLAKPDIISLVEDIAFTDARIAAMVDELEGMDSASVDYLWESAGLVLNVVKDYEDEGKARRLTKACRRLLGAIEKIKEKNDKYWEIQRVQEHRRRLSETEAQKLSKADMQIPASKAMALFDRQELIVIDAIKRLAPKEIQGRLLLEIGRNIHALFPGRPELPQTSEAPKAEYLPPED